MWIVSMFITNNKTGTFERVDVPDNVFNDAAHLAGASDSEIVSYIDSVKHELTHDLISKILFHIMYGLFRWNMNEPSNFDDHDQTVVFEII